MTKVGAITALVVAVAFAIVSMTNAGDPDILSDFIVPFNLTPNPNFFTYTGFRVLVGEEPPTAFNVTKASVAEFPALNGQSVSFAVLKYPPCTVNPPHTHPRSAELLLVIEGTLEVGFVDTTNKLYTQSLQLGDMFIFPKATALSAFGSANAGTVSVPKTLFTTGIDDTVLAMSFKTDVATIQKIKAGLAPKA
ncbi:hypothetical protein Syun_016620 [Stephania yunnanensis]|uniref:Germin-like protein n=1 Tax=Stephania yunnanensis TaxID=152371 RepID=A0AAP0P2C7_9MAGN